MPPARPLEFPPSLGRSTGVFWLIAAVPVLLYAFMAYRYALDAPLQDDYEAALAFLIDWQAEETLAGKAALLVSQHNEHRIVLDRAIFLAQHLVFGRLDFRLSILIGNLGWVLASLLLLLQVGRRSALPMVYLLPLPFLLFSWLHRENTLWAMGSLQNYWSLLFALMSLQGLAERRIWQACLSLPLAWFTSGSGIALIPLGAAWLAWKRDGRFLAWFAGTAMVCALLYFLDYEQPANYPSVSVALAAPLRTTAFFLAFLGAVVPVLAAAIPLGVLGVAASAVLARRVPGQDFTKLVLAFVILNALAAALARVGFGLDSALASRYAIFPLVAWSCLHVLLLHHVRDGRKRLALAGAATVLAAGLWAGPAWLLERNGIMLMHNHRRVASLQAWLQGDPSSLAYPEPARADTLLRESERLGIWSARRFKPAPRASTGGSGL